MKHSIKVGFSFGLTSGIITTLGLLVGLNYSTHSKLAVIGGILTIAIADAFSDAMGIHLSQESSSKLNATSVWESTLATFFTKLIFASSFVIPILLFELALAVWICIFWGLILLAIFSYMIARQNKTRPIEVITEHLGIAIFVILVSAYLGNWLSGSFSTR